jgi:hypothetical protein
MARPGRRRSKEPVVPEPDYAIPKRLTLTADAFETVMALIAKPRAPTKAMLDLMAGKPAPGEP